MSRLTFAVQFLVFVFCEFSDLFFIISKTTARNPLQNVWQAAGYQALFHSAQPPRGKQVTWVSARTAHSKPGLWCVGLLVVSLCQYSFCVLAPGIVKCTACMISNGQGSWGGGGSWKGWKKNRIHGLSAFNAESCMTRADAVQTRQTRLSQTDKLCSTK